MVRVLLVSTFVTELDLTRWKPAVSCYDFKRYTCKTDTDSCYMLLELVSLQEIVQYEPNQFIDSSCTSMHGWSIYVIYGFQFVTLSGDQNEVFEYLVLQSLLLKANFRKFNRQKIFFFFFNIWLLRFDFCVYKSFFTLEKAEIVPERHFKCCYVGNASKHGIQNFWNIVI